MLSDILSTINLFTQLLTTTGAAISILWYCLWTTKDHRLRRRFSEATQHLTPVQLAQGRSKNEAILRAYYQSKANARLQDATFTKLRRKVLLRRAKAALTMITVLDEHIAVAAKMDPSGSYLRTRMRIIDEMSAKR